MKCSGRDLSHSYSCPLYGMDESATAIQTRVGMVPRMVYSGQVWSRAEPYPTKVTGRSWIETSDHFCDRLLDYVTTFCEIWFWAGIIIFLSLYYEV